MRLIYYRNFCESEILHNVLDEKPKIVCNEVREGDIVRIMHTENEGFLTANLRYEHIHPEIYLSTYTGEF